MQTKTLLAVAIASGIAVSAQAEQTIEPIVVTATRTAQTVDETLASVTVITREEIERLQPAQLSDLLQHRAGLHFASNGPFGKNTSLFMRGTNSDHTVLLVDGVRMGSATNGSPSWESLPVAEIERIEIVRGPRASIYGADAIGGVVQIFTRQGEAGQTRLNAHSRVGSFNTRELGAGLRGGTDQTRWSLSANHLRTDGINVQDDSGDDDDDGYHNSSISWAVDHALPNGVELFHHALYTEGRSDFDADQWGVGPYPSAHHDFEQAALQLGLRGSIHDHWFSELAIGHARDASDTYHAGQFNSRYATSRAQLDWRNELNLGLNALWTVGLDWQQERVDSSADYGVTRRDNLGLYQVLQGRLNQHDLQASLRYDDNQAYGDHTTGQLAWGYPLNNQLRSRLSWGTAFKAPSFNDLYWPGSGNPELKPEESETVEAGLRYTQGRQHLDAALFHTEVDNLIAWAPTESGMWQPANINRARMQGLELEGGTQHGPWQVTIAATLLKAINLETDNELPRRPRQTLRLDLDRQLGAYSLGGSVIAQGSSYDNAANTVELDSHTLLNLRASWQASRDWTLRATVDNALDKDYQTAAGYNQPGRAFYLSASYQQ